MDPESRQEWLYSNLIKQISTKIKRYDESHFISINGIIHQEEITIINI
jgi:hypothetical protein